MVTKDVLDLIEKSIPLGLQQTMFDTALKVDKFITSRYPLRECSGCETIKRPAKSIVVRDFSSVGWGIYFCHQDSRHDSLENLIREVDCKKLWTVGVSLRGPFITSWFYPWKYHEHSKSMGWCYSPSHEDPNMMAFCEKIAQKFGVYYVTAEDLFNIKVDMSSSTEGMRARLDFTPDWDVDAYKMLFAEY